MTNLLTKSKCAHETNIGPLDLRMGLGLGALPGGNADCYNQRKLLPGIIHLERLYPTFHHESYAMSVQSAARPRPWPGPDR